ncbi:MAG: SLBB domain-containing protein [Verrucomicrobiota bacterium]
MRTPLLIALLFAAAVSSCFSASQDTPTAAKELPGVTVEGAVSNPGAVKFPVGRALTIVDAIALAGGHTGKADLKRVWLIRLDASGKPEKTVIDVDAIIKGRTKISLTLQDRDRIVLIGRDVDDNGW